jgi:hypothetical protein
MVEIQHHRVGLATVDARMRLQTRDDPIEQRATTRAVPRYRFVDVVLGVAGVVVANKGAATGLAV